MTLSLVTSTFNNLLDFKATYCSVKPFFETHIHEYIVIDSSSNKAVEEFVTAQSHSCPISINYFYVPPNGPYSAMNAGILFSTMQYIWILNSGDTVIAMPTDLPRVISSKSNHCFFGAVLKEVTSDILPYGHQSFAGWRDFRLHELHPTCIINRSVYCDVGIFNTAYRVAADLDLLIRASCNFKFLFLPGFVIYYPPGGISSQRREPIFNILRIIIKHPDFLFILRFFTRYLYGLHVSK